VLAEEGINGRVPGMFAAVHVLTRQAQLSRITYLVEKEGRKCPKS
jgi:hypothetical protein